MSTVCWKLVNILDCTHTYGYLTKSQRIDLGLEKTHANDAFCIAGGTTQTRSNLFTIQQVRRNNRSLEKFYDAKYIDIRTGKKTTGQELNNGRHTRNTNLNTENLRQYRGKKLSKGRSQIRKSRYPFQPGDVVLCEGRKYTVKGTQNLGAYVKLTDLPKPVRTDRLKHLRFGKGFSWHSSPTYAVA